MWNANPGNPAFGPTAAETPVPPESDPDDGDSTEPESAAQPSTPDEPQSSSATTETASLAGQDAAVVEAALRRAAREAVRGNLPARRQIPSLGLDRRHTDWLSAGSSDTTGPRQLTGAYFADHAQVDYIDGEIEPLPLRRPDYALALPGGSGPPPSGSKRRALLIGAALAAVLIGGVLAVSGAFSSEADTDGSAAAVSGEAGASGWCPPTTSGEMVSGAGPGSQNDPASVVLAFDHAYYVLRDGVKAREFLAPADPASVTAENLQYAIDSEIPVGTKHCVLITYAGENGNVAVRLTEQRPDGAAVVYKQTVSTANRDGKYVITSIGAVE
ncbi:hypothetical protein OG921_03165 [Aldersonia sp. NBC_00410]|uniref:hypothetical protein n=1 Tax=Aldersonia sp. NBC_00410 TaxID=2975954 RepID=UPI002252F43F|nr:hypothetical protein [Aldersonia sp. NBC_00410]MCX5042191.1 hypothetical protein [Aldersonia sp. NBC_00410]